MERRWSGRKVFRRFLVKNMKNILQNNNKDDKPRIVISPNLKKIKVVIDGKTGKILEETIDGNKVNISIEDVSDNSENNLGDNSENNSENNKQI